jgi:transglutaminase-like putative cysteine protease
VTDRRPRALLAAPAARLIVFALLGGLGALEWARMVDGLSGGRALTWVLVGLAAAGAVLLADRARPRLRGPLTLLAALGGLLAAFAVSGLDLGLLRASRLSELGEGLARGSEALGGVRLPYEGKDPWPALVVQLGGALLCVLAAMLAVWPRSGTRGHHFAALTALLVLVASPVVSLAAPKPLVFGAAVALLTAAFLWLERLPVRPGISAPALVAVTLIAALPLGAAADREEPWFDYRTFAESLGPADPVNFKWDHGYGPIDWAREGVELFRVKAPEPLYWKAETLGAFDGDRWTVSSEADPDGDRPEDDLPPGWRAQTGWTEELQFSLRRLRTSTVVGAGTIVDVTDTSRPVEPDAVAGRWIASKPLGRGDSYSVRVHVPRPAPSLLQSATSGQDGQQSDNLAVTVRFREDALEDGPRGPRHPNFPDGIPLSEGQVQFPAFGDAGAPVAHYPQFDVTDSGNDAMRRSTIARTWRLARQLKRGTLTPFEYVANVNAYLRSDAFQYSELPSPDGAEVGLERFLFDTRRGYCQHYSGAMALLLRLGGVPARVATGFSPGGFRKRRGEWVVRDTDAHSWVEVWYDEHGWVTVDPTPPATPARSQVAALEPGAVPAEVADAAPTATVVPPARDPAGIRPEPTTGGQAVDTSESPADDGRPSPLWLLLLLPLIGGALAYRRVRHWTPQLSVQDEIADLERALRRAGRAVPAGETLAQLERRLGGGSYLRALRSARYGAAAPPTAADRAAFRRELASGLGWSGAIRAWWALPPRIRLHRRPS